MLIMHYWQDITPNSSETIMSMIQDHRESLIPLLHELDTLVYNGRKLSGAERYFLEHVRSLAPNPRLDKSDGGFCRMAIPIVNRLLKT